MPEEIKPGDNQNQPPAGGDPNNPPAPNPKPSDEQQKKIKELEDQLKERDAKNAELATTIATIEQRERDLRNQKNKEITDAELKDKIKQINDRRAYDPEGADAEMALLLQERDRQIEERAAQRAINTVHQQSVAEKTLNQIKSANPEFSDRVAQQVLQLAIEYAGTRKYPNDEAAIIAATKEVKAELDNYATKKNASPQLPPGANAERGGGNPLPPQPPPVKEKSALEELNEFNEARARKNI